jgi:signal transduction histidine kinase
MEEIVSAMEEDVERMVRVTSRFSKIGGRAGAGDVDLVKVVTGVVDYMRARSPQRAANVTFNEDYGSPPPVLGQEELLEWVVENLLKNALDALGGKSGEITIRVTSDEAGRNAVLRVEDNGEGIHPSDQRHIFDAGFSRKRRGWGLGLALSRRLVMEFGGRLNLIRSRPGEGTLFEAVLPAAAPDTD